MTTDHAHPPDSDKIVVTAHWNSGEWEVTIPGHAGHRRAVTFAPNLAEVAPNAAIVLRAIRSPSPVGPEPCIEVNVAFDNDLANRYRNTQDPHDTAAILADAGLSEDDIDALVMARLHPLSEDPNPTRSRPTGTHEPWTGRQ
ncbi:MAG: hypothetical protein ACRD2C_20610 [Acidimicrobiales bacterium]